MNTIILDIETAPLPLDDAQVRYLTRDCATNEDRQTELDRAGLYPVTGQVVCIGMLGRGAGSTNTLLTRRQRSERQMLSDFWETVRAFDRIVTFNGRSFDVPFLLVRSAILGVVPGRFDLLGYRFAHHPHCDLLEQLTGYGATRKFPLELYCKAFGITSSKANGGGAEVAKWFAAGEHERLLRARRAHGLDELRHPHRGVGGAVECLAVVDRRRRAPARRPAVPGEIEDQLAVVVVARIGLVEEVEDDRAVALEGGRH